MFLEQHHRFLWCRDRIVNDMGDPGEMADCMCVGESARGHHDRRLCPRRLYEYRRFYSGRFDQKFLFSCFGEENVTEGAHGVPTEFSSEHFDPCCRRGMFRLHPKAHLLDVGVARENLLGNFHSVLSSNFL